MTPSACGLCAIPEREHMQRWASQGWHRWVPPTDAQILARMRARRASRATKTSTPGGTQ